MHAHTLNLTHTKHVLCQTLNTYYSHSFTIYTHYIHVYIGKQEKITITADKGRLSPEEIERMVKESEEFAEEDKKVHMRGLLYIYIYYAPYYTLYSTITYVHYTYYSIYSYTQCDISYILY